MSHPSRLDMIERFRFDIVFDLRAFWAGCDLTTAIDYCAIPGRVPRMILDAICMGLLVGTLERRKAAFSGRLWLSDEGRLLVRRARLAIAWGLR